MQELERGKGILSYDFAGAKVRAMNVEGKPWFVGNDLAGVLQYERVGDALSLHVAEEDKESLTYKAFGKNQKAGFRELWQGNDFSNKTIVNESGMYSLIFGSKMPEAKKFKYWVTSEVLPDIRKHGAYLTENTLDRVLGDPDFMIGLLQNLKKERSQKEKYEKQLVEQESQVLFANTITATESDIKVGALANMMQAHGTDIGQNRLFARMRDDGWLIKSGRDRNMPTQRAVKAKYLVVHTTVGTTKYGTYKENRVTMVTPKGQEYFVNRYTKK